MGELFPYALAVVVEIAVKHKFVHADGATVEEDRTMPVSEVGGGHAVT